MPSILPSHIVTAIDSIFGPNRNELDSRAVKHIHKVPVHALLAMLDEVPPQLIDLNARESLELNQCRAVLATKYRRGISGTLLPPTTWAEKT